MPLLRRVHTLLRPLGGALRFMLDGLRRRLLLLRNIALRLRLISCFSRHPLRLLRTFQRCQLLLHVLPLGAEPGAMFSQNLRR